MNLTSYRTIGKSGLIVSPLALGTMTFGAGRWGASEATSRALYDHYVDAGGNFIDTADIYSGGESETMLGRFLTESSRRDRLVVATKSGFSRAQGTPLWGGNGAKNIRLAIEASLKRLQTDYIDMYWAHVWDRTTPAEEVLQTLADAVRAGKILHYGFSNTPAWYVAKIATLAQAHGLPRPVGLQYAYSLLDRGVELDLLPAGQELGMGLVPWSPLGGGLLTGKYGREKIAEASRGSAMPDSGAQVGEQGSDGRLNGDNPFGGMLFTERNFDVVDVLKAVAAEIGRTPAEVALRWVVERPGVSSVLIGASRDEQLSQNIASLDVELTAEQKQRLEEATSLPLPNPYFIFQLPIEMLFGGQRVERW
ncbi:aryl-alcohol dehydrogenase-like predicted oxidoreductase [Pseudorhizobium tarimense]|uniref:Aryl-alcohol dehydrogenase-like predicted oxidoreductase n=1 Tax=Pseudorhizobium tarimense TaxID=1079109 RepID=A0ABV2H0G3_9HYPH|nr:aldo/keto reductase [Pseudorhizobium tarimense]MCJ8517363.1 aldo/keto reductase [Pseudorhizobium tarimense]